MNKKIKVIDLLKKIEKHEDIPKEIKYKDNCYIFKHANYSIDHLYELKESCIGWLEHKDINLFDEIEILEDNTEEIEEIDKTKETNIWAKMSDCEDKINELVKRIKYIERKINE